MLESETILQTINSRSLDMIDKETVSAELHPTIITNELGRRLVFQVQGSMRGDTDREEICPDSSAESQFLQRIRVPIDFFHRSSTGLQQSILNEHNRNHKFLLRCKIVKEASTLCRAVRSPGFSTSRDDIHIFPVVLESLRNLPNVELTQFVFDDHITELTATYMDTSLDRIPVLGGVSIQNSETGHSSIWIEPILVIGKYNLHNRWGDRSDHAKRIVHRGDTPRLEDIRNAITESKQLAQVGVIQFLRASEEHVSLEIAQDFIRNLEGFPSRFVKTIENDWIGQETITRLSVMQRILDEASRLPLIQQLTVKRQTGRFIRLFENCRAEITQMAEILNS